jgi:hypothetical protein
MSCNCEGCAPKSGADYGKYGGGVLQSRCFGVQFPAFFDRAQIADTTRPQVGDGTMEDYGRQTDIDSTLRPCITQLDGGCRTLRIPDGINFTYLPFGYQQPDTRPWTFRTDSRQDVKDLFRENPQDWTRANGNGRWKYPESYPRDVDCAPDPYTLANYNTTYKMTLV